MSLTAVGVKYFWEGVMNINHRVAVINVTQSSSYRPVVTDFKSTLLIFKTPKANTVTIIPSDYS